MCLPQLSREFHSSVGPKWTKMILDFPDVSWEFVGGILTSPGQSMDGAEKLHCGIDTNLYPVFLR